ncbi:snare protein syntaxin-like protein 18/UFE1 [Lindgomyces ingoldianus]|uniref:Snare protein syntaxin-like protein 18/UFE1 n=1 Tax=Lindgomyces ingoldianus TaxID=673940 RepID=A0ACB6RAY2_9PLEO|nr:snare protein syntaxin-like protein 18/UFE1 [Lindgomyces ingoldianus]KAF2475626.1 snare protein syntaxin-like protein 18/UFE1 [Lindgomyces ingoldianus]
MMNITSIFNQALAAHDALPVEPYILRLQDLDQFLKEAYRIRAHIAELNAYLRSIRQSYLSTALSPRRKQVARTNTSSFLPTTEKDAKYLTDTQRTEIDAQAKQLLRELNVAINNLSDAEQVRQSAETTIALKKRARAGLGALGRWAAGGAITAKSPQEELEEAKANTIKVHRESVIWYLQRQLEQCGRFQSSMMEIRLTREVEKSKSVLYKARGTMPSSDDYSGVNEGPSSMNDYRGKTPVDQDAESLVAQERLSPEQLQLFAQENQDMLKHYEDALDQVRTAEKSLLEISELQTTLANNLTIQAAHIDQLVEDSYLTTENVGSGNKELKRATERMSQAQMLFYCTSGFCAFLILWDLFI